MTLAAIVVAHNGGTLLEECVASLLAQSVPDLEIIVADNDSTDGSPQRIAHSFGAGVRILTLAENRGYAAGANAGWRATSAETVAIVNQDVVLEPDCLERMRAALLGSDRDALVSPKLVLRDAPDRVNAIGNEVHLTGVAWCHGLGSSTHRWRGTLEVTAISGALFMARRDLLAALGGLDEAFFMYYEDVDLSLRARLAGATCLVACEAVAAHHWEFSLPPGKFELLERNRRATWRRLWAGETRMLPAYWQAEAMGWGYALLHGPQFLRAKARARRRPVTPCSAWSGDARGLRPLLARRHPYESLAPSLPMLAGLGRAIDRVVAAATGAGR